MSARNFIRKKIGDPELVKIFGSMLGTGDPDPNIVIPKYERITQELEDITKILGNFARSPCAKVFYKDFATSFDELDNFLKIAQEMLPTLQLPPNDKVLTADELKGLNANQERLREMLTNVAFQYKIANLGECYTKLKDSYLVREIVNCTRGIKIALSLEKKRTNAVTHNLEDKQTLSADFIIHADGDFLPLFSFSRLDFKQLYLSDLMKPELSKYMLFMLHLVYKKGLEVVKDITSPDIDVDKFCTLLSDHIDELRKHIPRCDKAFDRIKQSIDLLRSNFDDYYKDFIISRNPTIIIENFVMDVARNTKADIALTRQFRTIVNFYHNQTRNQPKDPRIEKILQMLAENLSVLENKDQPEPGQEGKEEKEEVEQP